MKRRRRRKKNTGVRQRGKNSCQLNYYVNGKRITETIKASSESEASVVRLQRLAASSSKPIGKDATGEITLQRALELYLNETEKLLCPRTKQRSICIYNHLLRYLSQSFPNIRFVHEVTIDVAESYKNYLSNKPNKTPSGINTDITKLRAIFRRFKNNKFTTINSFKKISKIPRRLARPEKKYLPTKQQMDVILEAVKGDPSYEELTYYLRRAGRRIEESTLLLKGDVVCDENGKPTKVRIRKEITKGKIESELDLDDELVKIISKALAKHPEEKALFTNQYGRKIACNTYREHCLKRICKNKGIKDNITPHCFRYFVVNELLAAGIAMQDAMQITGHIDLESFLSYLQSTPIGRKKALMATRMHKE